MKRKFLIIPFILILVYSCQNADLNDASKRNENWVYWVDSLTGKASWIHVSDKTTVKNGRYISFYKKGTIFQKGKYKNGKRIDTIYDYDLNEKLLQYELVKPDTLIICYLHDGPFISFFQNGKLFEKGIVKNLKIGDKWTKYFMNGEIDWAKNLKNGTGLMRWYYDNGQISFVNYKVNGKVNGQVKGWYKNGQLKLISNWKDDLQNGACEIYYENGKLKEKENWLNDKLDGKRESRYDNGQMEQVEYYNNGVRDGQILQWYSNGNKKAAIKFVFGKVDGRVINYYENGKIKSQGDFKEGKRNGTFSWYDENGILTKQQIFVNDELAIIRE